MLLAILLQSPIAISCLKNRNTVGESPTNIRKVLRWESVISIGGGGCRRSDGQWRYLDMVAISFVLCFVMLCGARADREMMCERDIFFLVKNLMV